MALDLPHANHSRSSTARPMRSRQTRWIAVYGNFSGDTPKVRNWATAEVDVTITCPTLAVDESGDVAVTTGIYNGMANAPIVTVSANDVAYPSIFESLGLIDSNVEMNAASQAAVMGI
jgi:hypothetical protein